MNGAVRLACDGGQTGLRMIVLRGTERVGLVEVPGFSWTRAGDPVEQQADRVLAGWRAVGSPDPVQVLALGLAAGGSLQAERIRLCGLLGAELPVAEIRSTGDDVATHLGALGGRPGVVVAAGTGTLCLAIGPDGRRRNVDGLGYLFGDEGSGFWLGRAGIRAALAAVEGRGPVTLLADRLERWVGPLPLAVKKLYGSDRLVADVAAFAVEVDAAARAGDQVAERICREAADGLVGDAGAAIAALGDPAGPVAATGGVLAEGSAVHAAFAESMLSRLPRCRMVRPEGNASDGAVTLAGDRDVPHRAMAVSWQRGRGIVHRGSPDPSG